MKSIMVQGGLVVKGKGSGREAHATIHRSQGVSGIGLRGLPHATGENLFLLT
jgi:hypothetical protein